MKVIRWFAFFVLLTVVPCATEQKATSVRRAKGALIIRVEDGTQPRCINRTADTIYVTLRRLITVKHSGIFTKDKSAGVVIETTVSGKLSDEGTKKLTFPLMKEVSVEDYAKGHGVSIPIEYPVAQGFDLRSGKTQYVGLQFDFSVIAKKKKNPWGIALEALASFSKNVGIPAFPFAEGFKWFVDYANSAVDKSLEEQNKSNNLLKMGAVNMNFSPDGKGPSPGKCNGDFQTTGTVAVVQAVSKLEEGYIDTNRPGDYDFKADLTPAFVLKFCKKDADGNCTNFVDVQNDYIAFYVYGGPEGSAVKAADTSFWRDEAKKGCAANGVSEENCLSRKAH
jgi:hypothetical protein